MAADPVDATADLIAQVAPDGTVVYQSTDGGTDAAVQVLANGAVRLQTVTSDASGPNEFTYTFGKGTTPVVLDDETIGLAQDFDGGHIVSTTVAHLRLGLVPVLVVAGISAGQGHWILAAATLTAGGTAARFAHWSFRRKSSKICPLTPKARTELAGSTGSSGPRTTINHLVECSYRAGVCETMCPGLGGPGHIVRMQKRAARVSDSAAACDHDGTSGHEQPC